MTNRDGLNFFLKPTFFPKITNPHLSHYKPPKNIAPLFSLLIIYHFLPNCRLGRRYKMRNHSASLFRILYLVKLRIPHYIFTHKQHHYFHSQSSSPIFKVNKAASTCSISYINFYYYYYYVKS